MFRLISFLFLLGFALSPKAFAGDAFTVSGVHVDATADNALDAQTRAIQAGQLEAARILVERLSLSSERAAKHFNGIAPEEGAKMIRGLSIANEKRSSNRYLGDITVAFSPPAVAAVMKAHGLRMIATQDRKRLVIPLYEDRQVFAPNPWLKAWQDMDTSNTLTPMVVISPSPDVFSILSQPGASLSKLTTLQHIGRLYGVDKVLLLQARPQNGEIVSQIRDIALDTGLARRLPNVRGYPAETVARAALKSVEEDWKDRVVARSSATSQDLPLTALFDSARAWVRLQETLKNMDQISATKLLALSNHGASLIISYKGDIGQLRDELAYKGVVLKTDEKLGPVLSLSGG